MEVLRQKDLEILEFNKKYLLAQRHDVVELDFSDYPFAQFPFVVTQEQLPYVIIPQEVKK